MKARLCKGTIVMGLLAVVCAPSALGCRYSVRDVGFVDLGTPPYTLYAFIDSKTSEELVSQINTIAYAALLDTNIEPETIHIEQQSDHPAMKYYRDRRLQRCPALVLVAPDERSLEVPLDTGEGDSVDKSRLWASLEAIADSPARDAILDKTIDAYGIVLLVEGTNAEHNRMAQVVAQTCIDEISSRMSQMDKPVDVPPQLVVIPQDQLNNERVLIWSLGIDTTQSDEPYVAVIYGRARKIGDLLQGEQIAAPALYGTLSTIGQSCECGLEREWMMGVMLPARWSDRAIQEASEKLAFDTENPMVKAEISQILSIGASRRPQGIPGAAPSVQELLLGYSESTITFNDSATESNPAADETGVTTENGATASEVQSSEIRNDIAPQSDTTLHPPGSPGTESMQASMGGGSAAEAHITFGFIFMLILGGVGGIVVVGLVIFMLGRSRIS